MQYVLRKDEDHVWYVVPVDMLSQWDEWAWVSEDGWPDRDTLPYGIIRIGDIKHFSFTDWQWWPAA